MDGKLNRNQGLVLLAVARKTLSHRLGQGDPPEKPLDAVFEEGAATFVTLKLSGQLRGCIGNLEPVGPLWQGVRDNAISAAFYDHRFSPITFDELREIRLEVSILSPPIPLQYHELHELPQKLHPGVDGVILRDGKQGATFLPQVWRQLPRPEQFLGHLCLKAGLSELIWQKQKLEILTYQVQYFEEEVE